MSTLERRIDQLEHFPTRDDVLAEALRQKPDLFDKVGEEKSIDFIDKSLVRTSEFDNLARGCNLPQTSKEAEKLKAVVLISAPGTYLNAFKEDRYKSFPWAAWMDKRRIDYGAWLVRRITEIRTGETLTNNPDHLSEAIENHGPYLLYSGYDEVPDFLKALNDSGTKLPKSKVCVIDDPIENTVAQMEKFYFPPEIQIEKEDVVGFVLHSPQMLRMLHIMDEVANANKRAILSKSEIPFPNFPFDDKGPKIKVFPIASPHPQNIISEICGIIHYAFYANPSKASENPHPYVV